MLAVLLGIRGNAGDRPSIGIDDIRRIPDNEDVRKTGYAHVGFDLYPARIVGFGIEPLSGARSLDSGRPDDRG